MVPRPDARVDESSVSVDVGGDTPAPHVCHQGQRLTQLLPLTTQADHCIANHILQQRRLLAQDLQTVMPCSLEPQAYCLAAAVLPTTYIIDINSPSGK